MSGQKKLETNKSKLNAVGFRSFTSCTILFALFAYTLLTGGCTPTTESGKFQTTRPKKLTQMSTEDKKFMLLKEINHRFDNPDAHFELGQLYQAEGLLVSAEYHYSTALRFNPVHRDAQAAMVKIKIENGDTAGAKLQADTYMREVSTSSAGSCRLGMAFQKQELDEYALACYQQALRINPESAESYKQLGYYYLGKGDKVRARDYLSRSFEIKSNQPDVAHTLGQLGVEIKIPQKTEINTELPKKNAEGSEKQNSGS
jgi:tetratricopeptide (TPR) repeat protein